MGAETSKGFRAPFLSTAFDYIPYHYLGDIVEDSLFLSENAQLSARIIENNIKFSGLDKKYSTFRIYPRGPLQIPDERRSHSEMSGVPIPKQTA